MAWKQDRQLSIGKEVMGAISSAKLIIITGPVVTSITRPAELTRRPTGYFEWYGLYTTGWEDNLSEGFLDVGVDYSLINNAAIDFRISWGLTDDSDDLFAGAGGGVRI